MKFINKYETFLNESDGYYSDGDIVKILFRIEGTDKRELIPVKILKGGGKNKTTPKQPEGELKEIPVKIIKKRRNSNTYLVSFNVENNPIRNHRDMEIKSNKIIGSYQEIKEPMNPSWTKIQPVPTDYNKAGDLSAGGITNDYVLPTS